jgi:hypothetical protein
MNAHLERVCCVFVRARVPRGGGGGVARAPVCMTVSSFGAMNFFVMSQKLVSGRKLVCLFVFSS